MHIIYYLPLTLYFFSIQTHTEQYSSMILHQLLVRFCLTKVKHWTFHEY